jgi:hypothetical protein
MTILGRPRNGFWSPSDPNNYTTWTQFTASPQCTNKKKTLSPNIDANQAERSSFKQTQNKSRFSYYVHINVLHCMVNMQFFVSSI